MVIRGSRKLLIKQLDTSLIQENVVRARGRDAHQIGPRVMVIDADRIFAHGICTTLDRGCSAWIALKLRPAAAAIEIDPILTKRPPRAVSFKRMLGGPPWSVGLCKCKANRAA